MLSPPRRPHDAGAQDEDRSRAGNTRRSRSCPAPPAVTAPENSGERVARYADPVGPRTELPAVIEQSLAHVEYHGEDHAPAYGQRSPYGDRVINKIKLPYLLGLVRSHRRRAGRLGCAGPARSRRSSPATAISRITDASDDYPSLPAGEIDTSEAEEALPDGAYLVTVEGDGARTPRRSGRRQTAAGVRKVNQYGVLTGAWSSGRNVRR